MKKIHSAPPLTIWLYVIIALSAIYGVIRVQFYKDPDNNNIYNIKTGQIIRHYQKYASKEYFKVVVIGSSLTESYIMNYDYFFGQQKTDPGFKLCLYKLSVRASNPGTFCKETRILQLLLEQPPDLLLVEDNIVCYSDKNKIRIDDLIKMREFSAIFQLRNKLLHLDDSIPFYYTQKSETRLTESDKMLQQRAQRYYNRRKIRTLAQNKVFDSLLTCFIKKKCDVKIISFPRPPAIYSYITDHLKNKNKELLATYSTQYHIETLTTGDTLSNSYFCDYLHVNKYGQEKFSEELYTILKNYHRKE